MPASRFIQLAIVASTMPVRLGLRAMLLDDGDFAVIAEAASLAGLDLDTKPDVIITTEEPQSKDTFWTEQQALPALLCLTSRPQAAKRLFEWQAGTWGILPLDTSAQEISAAVHALAVGLWVGDPTLTQQLLAASPAGLPEAFPEDESLTNREMEVLQGLSQGLANKQIGLALGISEHTVKFHVSAIYAKLSATNRTEAVRIGVQRGLVTL